MGVVWAEFVTTSIIWVTTSKKTGVEGMGSHYAERACMRRILDHSLIIQHIKLMLIMQVHPVAMATSIVCASVKKCYMGKHSKFCVYMVINLVYTHGLRVGFYPHNNA